MVNAIVSFFAAVLAGMGVGSGGIMVVWFTLAASMPQLEAQLLNLIFFASALHKGNSLFSGKNIRLNFFHHNNHLALLYLM